MDTRSGRLSWRRPSLALAQLLERRLIGLRSPELAEELLKGGVLAAVALEEFCSKSRHLPPGRLPRAPLAVASHLPAVADEDQGRRAVRRFPEADDAVAVLGRKLRDLVHHDQVVAKQVGELSSNGVVQGKGCVAGVNLQAGPPPIALAHSAGQLSRRKGKEDLAFAAKELLNLVVADGGLTRARRPHADKDFATGACLGGGRLRLAFICAAGQQRTGHRGIEQGLEAPLLAVVGDSFTASLALQHRGCRLRRLPDPTCKVVLNQNQVGRKHVLDALRCGSAVALNLQLAVDLCVVRAVAVKVGHGQVAVLRRNLRKLGLINQVEATAERLVEREPLAVVAVAQARHTLRRHNFLALHLVADGKIFQGLVRLALGRVLLLQPRTDLAVRIGLAQEVQQTDPPSGPGGRLVEPHLVLLGQLRVRHDEVAFASLQRREVPLAKLRAEQLQDHFGLHRMIPTQHRGCNADGVRIVIQPLLRR